MSTDKFKEFIKTNFEPDSSPANKAVAILNELIGYPYPVKVDWGALREDIPQNVLDDESLVSRVSDAIAAFVEKLVSLLESDPNHFSDRFLEKTESRSRQIVVKPHPLEQGSMPFTRFTDDAVVEVYLPRVRAGYASDALFGQDLEEALGGVSSLDPRAQTENLAGVHTKDSKVSKLKVLPLVGEIPRPEVLMRKTPLYLRLYEHKEKSTEWFQLEGYQPVVDLVETYLEKHAKQRYNKLELYRREIRWGENLSILSCSTVVGGLDSSALIVVKLLESVLGFERVGVPVSVGSESVTLFKRDEEFMIL